MAPTGHDVPRLRPCLLIGLLLLLVSQLTQAQCFFNPTSYTVGARPQSVVVADLTGDGQDDVITANQLSGNVAVLPGQAGGGLGTPLYYDMDDAPYAVAVADLNKDNLPDLITINVDGGYVTVRLALPGGIFGLTTNYSLGASPVSIAVADINYDGQLDIITANASSNSVTVLPGIPLPGGLAFVSFDAPVSYAVGRRPVSVKVADVNGDGMLDIITANTDSDNVSVLRRLITRTFAPAEQFPAGDAPTDVVIAKVDGDPFYDMVVSNFYDQTVSVILAERLGDFAAPVSYRVGIWPTAVVVADVTNDGQVDIISNSSFSNTVSVLPGRSAGGFRPSVSYAVGNLPDALAVADITKDGRPDIISVNKSSNDITVLPGQAPGVITQQPVSGSTVAPGTNVRVSVGISGTTTSLQWYNQAGVVSGQTSATLTLNGVTPDQAGSYSLVVATPCNTVTSTAFTLTVQLPPSIRYVKVGGTGDGSSWAAASGDLQAMLNAAGVEQVRIAAGLYKPTTTADRTVSFVVPNGVQVYGGYVAGTDTRTTNPSSTTLSGDIDGDNTLAGNSYHVVQTRGRNVVLDGLFITQGDARPLTELVDARGGGLFVNTSRGSLTLRAVQFINNAARNGGGMLAYGSTAESPTSVTLINCLFSQNITTTMNGRGAGLYLSNISGTLTNCSFIGNVASFGGALFTDNSNPNLKNCMFNGNTATSGGGIYNDFSSPMMTNCSFVGNSASGLGGGMVNADSSPTLTNCSFSGNSSSIEGGGAIINAGANRRSDLVLINCIIWGQPVQAVVNNGASSTTYRYTDSQDRLQPGEGNRSVDPLFVDAPNGNLQLTACSPLIDAGDNSVDAGETDLVGNNRRQRTIDMGAFEFQGAPDSSGVVAITQQPPTNSFGVCEGVTVVVAVSTSGTVSAYQWYKDGNPLNGQTSAALTVTNTTTASSGSYLVVVTGTCNSVTSTAFSLTVNPNPTLSIAPGSATLTCASPSVSLTAIGAGSVRWEDNSTSAIRTVSAPGTYSAVLTSINGCTASATTTVESATGTVNATLAASGTITCANTSVTLTAASGGSAYAFSAGAQPIGTTNRATVTQGGTYSVVVTSASGCTGLATTTVESSTATPLVSLVSNGTISCANISVTLTASPEGQGTYAFRSASGILPSTANTAVVTAGGTYSVVVTGANGCSATNSTTVESSTNAVNASLVASGTLTCANTSVTLTASPIGQAAYAFSAGASQIDGSAGNTATVTKAGTYTVTITNSSGCTATATATVFSATALPSLTLTASPSLAITQGQTVTLTASSNTQALSFVWSNGATTPSINPPTTTVGVFAYSVTATTGGGCEATATASLTVSPNCGSPLGTIGQPLTLLEPTYNCQTGMIQFRTSGGNGSPITFAAIGITGPTTSCSAMVDAELAFDIRNQKPSVQPFTLFATQGNVTVSYAWNALRACAGSGGNGSPQVLRPVGPQSATVGVGYSLDLSGVFTDTETPGQLSLSVRGLPQGLSLVGNTILGTPSLAGVSSVSLTATDPGGLFTSTLFSFSVSPVQSNTGVGGPLSATVVSYDCGSGAILFGSTGGNGSLVEYFAIGVTGWTTNPGQTIESGLRADPRPITLRVRQGGMEGQVFVFDFGAFCQSGGTTNTPPVVANPVAPQSATVGVGYSLNVGGVFSDAQTPAQLALSVSGLPQGLSLQGSSITGTPSASGVSSLTLVATDPGGLTASTSFVLTVSPAGSTTGVGGPLSATVVSYDCGSGAIVFGSTGGTGSPVEYFAIGVTGWTASPGQTIEAGLRADPKPITIRVRQGGMEGTPFVFDFGAFCQGRARVGREAAGELAVTVLGNPTTGHWVEVEVRGSAYEGLTFKVLSAQGQVVSHQTSESTDSVVLQRVELGESAGTYFVQVVTPSRSKTVKVVRQ